MNRKAGRAGAPRAARAALGVLPLAAVAVLALTGCDPLQAGAAAVVGSTRITESQVNKDAQTVVQTLTGIGAPVPATADLLRAEVELRVDDELVAIAAARQGIVISQGEIDRLISQSGGRTQLQKQLVAQASLWLPPSSLDALAREFLQQQQLGERLAPGASSTAQAQALTAYITRIANEVGVAVSPRYGVWNANTLRISPDLNDLSVPAAAASAAPTG